MCPRSGFCTVVPFFVSSFRFWGSVVPFLVPSFWFWGSREHPPKPPCWKPPCREPLIEVGRKWVLTNCCAQNLAFDIFFVNSGHWQNLLLTQFSAGSALVQKRPCAGETARLDPRRLLESSQASSSQAVIGVSGNVAFSSPYADAVNVARYCPLDRLCPWAI